jgi:hypothetical protein
MKRPLPLLPPLLKRPSKSGDSPKHLNPCVESMGYIEDLTPGDLRKAACFTTSRR